MIGAAPCGSVDEALAVAGERARFHAGRGGTVGTPYVAAPGLVLCEFRQWLGAPDHVSASFPCAHPRAVTS